MRVSLPEYPPAQSVVDMTKITSGVVVGIEVEADDGEPLALVLYNPDHPGLLFRRRSLEDVHCLAPLEGLAHWMSPGEEGSANVPTPDN